MLTELWELIRRLIEFFWHMPPAGHSSSESPLGNPIQNEEPRDIQSAISDEPTLNLAASSVRAMPLSNHNAKERVSGIVDLNAIEGLTIVGDSSNRPSGQPLSLGEGIVGMLPSEGHDPSSPRPRPYMPPETFGDPPSRFTVSITGRSSSLPDPASDSNTEESLSTPLVGKLFALGIKIIDQAKYAGRNLQIRLLVDRKDVMTPIAFKEGTYPNNEFHVTFPEPISFQVFLSSKMEMTVFIDGISPGILDGPQHWNLSMLLNSMPLTSQGILFNTLFIVQISDTTEREGPLNLIAEKFAQLARTLDDGNTDPHAHLLRVSVDAMIVAACKNAHGRDTRVADHMLVQPLVLLIDTAIEFCQIDSHGDSMWTLNLVRSVGEHIARGVILLDSFMTRTLLDDKAAEESLAEYIQALQATRLCITRISNPHIAPVVPDQLHSKVKMSQIYDIKLDLLAGATFDITLTATPERMRFVDCKRLVEYDRLRILELVDYGDISHIPYSAVSYVWRGNLRLENPEASNCGSRGTFVVKDVETDGDPINIDLLLYAAKVSLDHNLQFTWIDRLCILQKEKQPKRDKPWQLERMHSFYQECGLCIVMPDGLFSMVYPEQHTPWMERIWTMEEALLPPDVQILFAWTRGPGLLIVINDTIPEFDGAVIGFVEQLDHGVGMIPLVPLLQCSGRVAFLDAVGKRHLDIEFNMFRGSGMKSFSTAASLFRMQPQAEEEPKHSNPLEYAFAYKRRDVRLWHSAFARDATYHDDIIIILARLLGFEKRNIPGEKGLRQYRMNAHQKRTFGIAIELTTSISPLTRSRHFNWNMRRMMYDLFYTFDIGPFYNYLILPPYNRLYVSPPLRPQEKPPLVYEAALPLTVLAKIPLDISIDSLCNLLTIPFATCEYLRSLSIHGESSKALSDATMKLPTSALVQTLKLLPSIRYLSLSAFTVEADYPMTVHASHRLQDLKIDNLHSSQSSSSSHDYAALLSLFDIETLRINTTLSPPQVNSFSRQSNGIVSYSSEPTDNLTTRLEFPDIKHPIHGICNLYMNCSTSETFSWLAAIMDVGLQREAVSSDHHDTQLQSFKPLRKVDVICEDVRAAYVLGDFLRSQGGSSIDHFVLDLAQLCRYHTPFQAEDPVRAIMYSYPHPLKYLTIRLQWPVNNILTFKGIDSSSSNNIPWNQIITSSTVVHFLRSLLEVFNSSPVVIDACNLEIDIGNDTDLTLEILMEGLATSQVADALRNFIDYGWPRFSKSINFLWRRPVEAHEGCIVNAEDLLTKLPSALRIHQQKTVRLTEAEATDLTN
ncbi:hypothetical protein QCA50_010159 [Cerrena zonata]|uniref:Heterokaryon incompatibility domain-containing protein n=1 Tax=Cerrena zonata TaxID=2478898 RepID=A0AAW0G8J6_9APHY